MYMYICICLCIHTLQRQAGAQTCSPVTIKLTDIFVYICMSNMYIYTCIYVCIHMSQRRAGAHTCSPVTIKMTYMSNTFHVCVCMCHIHIHMYLTCMAHKHVVLSQWKEHTCQIYICIYVYMYVYTRRRGELAHKHVILQSCDVTGDQICRGRPHGGDQVCSSVIKYVVLSSQWVTLQRGDQIWSPVIPMSDVTGGRPNI